MTEEREFTLEEYKNMVANLQSNYTQMQKAFKSAERLQQARTWAVATAIDISKIGVDVMPRSSKDIMDMANELVPYAMVQIADVDAEFAKVVENS